MTIAQIKAARLLHDISQAELSHLAHMDAPRLCNAERSNIELKAAELAALEAALKEAIRTRARRIHAAMPEIFAELMV